MSKKENKEDKKYLRLLGKVITSRREAAGLSVEALASKVDLSRMHIYRIENGEHSPSITILRKIAEELGMSVGELVNVP